MTAEAVVAEPQKDAAWSLARFWSRVDTSGGIDACWPWLGAIGANGYGAAQVDGVLIGTHRFVLEQALGRAIDPGLYACHTCDNPPCCNPLHVYEGTPGDNARDAVIRNRRPLPPQSRPRLTCKRGHSMADAHVGADGNRRCRVCRREADRHRRPRRSIPGG